MSAMWKGELLFSAPTKNCESCGCIIKTGSNFYTTDDAKHCFCAYCFNKTGKKGCIYTIGGELSFPKSELCKGVGDVQKEEEWVQCGNCQLWQHQVCALYNSVLDSQWEMSYICAHCRLVELQRVKEDVRGGPFQARDLLRTDLSEYIEDRLSRSMRLERNQRAALLGLRPDDVPGAEDIVVRVVLSVNKEIEVKQQYLNILKSEGYPSKFPYKSKVILLFQRIEGAEVCIFAMYVQEFGSKCGQPNQRSVYISYLDSVRYFMPDVKTISGESLRTFIYHEVLIGYLDYCKNHSFNTCYIWVCPPSTGDDYILYCHPETQKIPKPKKLLKWYKTMLKRAYAEKVVAECTTFYDCFLVPRGNKITAARLPYFEGAYWTAAIEEIIEQSGKVNSSTTILKRTFRLMGHDGLSPEAAEDVRVMQELEHRMLPVKENFLVVHLQSQLTQVDVAANTEDNNDLIDNDIFRTRITFLDFCKEKHYQFDTLRRAKHSSMMILYNLLKDAVFKFFRNIRRPSLKVKDVLDVISHGKCLLISERLCAGPDCVMIRELFLHVSLQSYRIWWL